MVLQIFKYQIKRQKIESELGFKSWTYRSLARSSTNWVILVQLIEHQARDRRAGGSNPRLSLNFYLGIRYYNFYKKQITSSFPFNKWIQIRKVSPFFEKRRCKSVVEIHSPISFINTFISTEYLI